VRIVRRSANDDPLELDTPSVEVTLVKTPSRYWYSGALKGRFVIDPCEYDEGYRSGVSKIERSMEQNNKWDMRWIQKNTSRHAPLRRSCSVRPVSALWIDLIVSKAKLCCSTDVGSWPTLVHACHRSVCSSQCSMRRSV
jgi:hypothetical protein